MKWAAVLVKNPLEAHIVLPWLVAAKVPLW